MFFSWCLLLFFFDQQAAVFSLGTPVSFLYHSLGAGVREGRFLPSFLGSFPFSSAERFSSHPLLGAAKAVLFPSTSSFLRRPSLASSPPFFSCDFAVLLYDLFCVREMASPPPPFIFFFFPALFSCRFFLFFLSSATDFGATYTSFFSWLSLFRFFLLELFALLPLLSAGQSPGPSL